MPSRDTGTGTVLEQKVPFEAMCLAEAVLTSGSKIVLPNPI